MITGKKISALILAVSATFLSAPAFASYAYVTAYGAGPTRQAAVSYAVGSASLACRQKQGNLVSYSVSFEHQDALGNWSVQVAGTCFIYP